MQEQANRRRGASGEKVEAGLLVYLRHASVGEKFCDSTVPHIYSLSNVPSTSRVLSIDHGGNPSYICTMQEGGSVGVGGKLAT